MYEYPSIMKMSKPVSFGAKKIEEEPQMKKRLLSLALALACCLGLAVPVSAAVTKKVVEDQAHGVKITMNGFLRVETHRYNRMVWHDEETGEVQGGWTFEHEIYVVADNSTVTIEALEGRKYADPSFVAAMEGYNRWGTFQTGSPQAEAYEAFQKNLDQYAFEGSSWWDWDPDKKCFEPTGGRTWPLEKARTETVTPSSDAGEYGGYIALSECFEVSWMCESDYAELVPATLQASNWAKTEVATAYDAEIMPFSPYLVDCTKGMTREDFAAVTVYLYSAMMGNPGHYPDVSEDHPFTDVDWENRYESEIGMAYNLGFIKGSNSAGTLFSPKGTLTRQEAAVMLGRVFTKLGGTIPAVSNTSFADDGNVAGWAKSEVAFMSGKDIVKGVGDNKFAPTKTLSIQEAVIMANRMLETLK